MAQIEITLRPEMPSVTLDQENYIGDNITLKIDNSADGLDESLMTFISTTGEMAYACFLRGTHIATPSGEVLVEALRAGDAVLTASGGIATINWIGYRTLRKALISHKDAIRAFTITFTKDAIGPNLPHRDLTVSPDHHEYFDGKLIPAMLLVNGKTSTQDFKREVFEYLHIELERFDRLLAEGVLSRSAVVRDTTTRARRDLRNVGVGLAHITVENNNERRDIDLNDDQLSGLHNVQDVNGVVMRWTDGAGRHYPYRAIEQSRSNSSGTACSAHVLVLGTGSARSIAKLNAPLRNRNKEILLCQRQ